MQYLHKYLGTGYRTTFQNSNARIPETDFREVGIPVAKLGCLPYLREQTGLLQ